MVLYFEASYESHEAGFRSDLDGCAIKCEMFRDSELIGEFSQSVTNAIAIDCSQVVNFLEATLMAVNLRCDVTSKRLSRGESCVCRELAV